MMKRLGLTSCAALALAWALPASAELPRDVQLERLGPTRIAVTWTGALVADETYSLSLGNAEGVVDASVKGIDGVAGLTGRAELEHGEDIRPYVVVRDGRGRSMLLGERVLPLEGGVNFRDLGGYRTPDGRSVRWGRIFRSGVMSDLTDADYDYLQMLGIKVICDLRAIDERAAQPTQASRISPLGSYLGWDYEQDFDGAALATAFSSGADPEAAALRMMAGFYRAMPGQFAPRFREAFDALKRGDSLLFNCSAGKDRTGLLAALILTTLGVAPETVVADYDLSQHVYPKADAARRAKQAAARQDNEPSVPDPTLAFLSRLPPEALKVLMGVDPIMIESAFDQIRADYGSLDRYIEHALGVSPADRVKLQQLYLDAAVSG